MRCNQFSRFCPTSSLGLLEAESRPESRPESAPDATLLSLRNRTDLLFFPLSAEFSLTRDLISFIKLDSAKKHATLI